MKKLFLLLIILITINNVSYASFPVSSNTQIQVVDEMNFGSLDYTSSTPLFGRLSITFALISLLFYILAFTLE